MIRDHRQGSQTVPERRPPPTIASSRNRSSASNQNNTNKPPLANNSANSNHNSTSPQQPGQQQAPEDPQQPQYRYPMPYPMPFMGPLSPGSVSRSGPYMPYPYSPMYMPYVYAPSPSQAPSAQSGAPGALTGVPCAPGVPQSQTRGGRFGSGVAPPATRDPVRDDASSIEQLGASVGKVVVSQDGLFANSLLRRADGSLIDITPPGIVRDEETKDHQKTVTYEAQTPFGESIRATRRE
ncbi:hypothetical protein PMAYCL1PPCAC_00076 [Pristionchus mayeri]|uniref:Uncharacterized protein n=1 Tax=Pristionchus mayeri TaxID=1317129 RepID=A0AAN4YWU4_9BILA|nr:hypothetical protein PMAYCL1PPCAC_00076 [Pristionchus mayeri]